MRVYLHIFIILFSSTLFGQDEQSIPHPADSFCKALGVDVYQLKMSKKEADAIFHCAGQYIRAHNNEIRADQAPDSFWITTEILLAGVSSKKSYELVKLVGEIKEGKNKQQPSRINEHTLRLKFAIARLQKGSINDKKFAWMLAYSLNQLSLKLIPEMHKDFNVLFAMVDQNVQGMSLRPVRQKKFIPSIITAKVMKGTPLAAGQKLANNSQFLTSNKSALLSKAEIRQIYTVTDDQGNDKIEIKTLKSQIHEGRSHRSTSFDFDIGLSLMANVSFSEVVSLLSTRYPYLEPFKEVVFSVPEDINDDSSSSGLGLTLLLLSLYEGVKLDENVISCADISVNGHVLPAYDMTEKIRKAGTSRNGIVIISTKDYQALMDAFVIWGHSALWNCQVIAARDTSEAVNIARSDRSSQTQKAIDEFKAIQQLLRKNPQNISIHRSKIMPKLVSVINKLPTHASARALHSVLNGKIPRELSLNTSLDLFSKTCKPILKEMFEGTNTNSITRNACKVRLNRVSKGLNKSMTPLIEAMNSYISATSSRTPTEDDKKAFLLAWSDLTKNRKFVDRMR